MCQKFVRGVREVEAGVQGIVDQISILRPPETPDLERVHSGIDQCQVLIPFCAQFYNYIIMDILHVYTCFVLVYIIASP